MGESNPVISLQNIGYSWTSTQETVIDISEFELNPGEKIFLHGSSGSGKSTLLNIIAAVIKPQTGRVWVNNVDLNTLSGAKADRFRADNIGLVFQQFNLLPFLSVIDNVMLPCRFSELRRENASANGHSLKEEAERLLQAMNLPSSISVARSAMLLSVGQQQRVAAARALMGMPSLIIADEPTSSLDADSREAFINLLFKEVATAGASLLFVSHDSGLRTMFDRSVAMADLNRVVTALEQA